MAGAADITLFTLKQPLIIAGVGRMTGGTPVFLVPDEMVVGRRHLFPDVIMTLQAGIDAHRHAFADMAVVAAFSIRFVQDITDHGRPVTAMGTMAGSAVSDFLGEVRVLLLDRLKRMAALADLFRLLDEQVAVV